MIQTFSRKNKYQCCGCELCATVCPISIISMRADEEGFLYPTIKDSTACIDCHLCEIKCPILNRCVSGNNTLRFLSAISKDEDNIKTSSSGGIATIISELFIGEGGVVYGVKYAKDFETIEYSRADSKEDLFAFKTSKYCQSSKGEIWKDIKEDSTHGRNILFIGLPCEIAALNNLFPNKDNIFTVELVCHGVTSPLVHESYIKSIKSTGDYSQSVMDYFSVRYKLTGWKPYYINAHFSDGKQFLRPFKSSPYDIAFRYLKRPSCNQCCFKYGDKQYGLQADITIGDNHGVRKDAKTYNKWGSSVVLVHTVKGQELLDSISSVTVFEEEKEDLVFQNLALYKSFPMKTNRYAFSRAFVSQGLFAACKLPSVVFNEKRIEIIKIIKSFKQRLRKLF